MSDTSYDVRVYAIEKRRNAEGKITSYRVAWKTGAQKFTESFRRSAQADAYRSNLMTAAKEGEAFSLLTGEPVTWERRDAPTMTWYAFACKYADMKWKTAAAKYRQDIARALTAATPAMYTTTRGKPSDRELRTAMHRWGFNTKHREHAPEEVAPVLKWLAANTRPVSALRHDTGLVRDLLDAATTRLDGRRAAATTVRKHRMLLSNALSFAVELRMLEANPLESLKWKPPASAAEVDARRVINHEQAKRLLDAVAAQKPSGKRLVAFFALIYYAALRPEEALNLRRDNITLPATEAGDAWGELHLRKATPHVRAEWTDGGTSREERALKHRPDGATRLVPAPPPLVRILRTHLDQFTRGSDSRLFYGVQGGDLPPVTYRRAWRMARKGALTPQEFASPLAARPYDLRHACVSTWLNAGVPVTQVAEWAGHSEHILLKVYAKCVVGQDELAKKRISEALGE